MAVTLAAFRVAFPEFVDVGDPLVQAKLDEAALRCDPTVWVHLTDAGIGWLAAALLAASPFGRNARMQPDTNLSTYAVEYNTLAAAVSCGFRLI